MSKVLIDISNDDVRKYAPCNLQATKPKPEKVKKVVTWRQDVIQQWPYEGKDTIFTVNCIQLVLIVI